MHRDIRATSASAHDIPPHNKPQGGGADEDVSGTENRKAYSVLAPTLQLSFAYS